MDLASISNVVLGTVLVTIKKKIGMPQSHRDKNPRAYKQKDVLNAYGADGATISVPLVAARLCLDCDVVYMADRCPRCSSKSALRLADYIPVLNGVVERDTEQLPKKVPKNLVQIKKGGRR